MTGTLTLWRLYAKSRAAFALSGRGAARFGGRWNLPGTRVLYCAESRALAAMEVLVHVEDLEDMLSLNWQTRAIELPRRWVESPRRYPASWRAYPYRRETQEFGSGWARARRSVALRVPSAVVPGEFNYLLNPDHPDFRELKIHPPEVFRFDRRLG